MATTPAYKKAYVVLQEPVSLPDNLFPFNFFEAEEQKMKEQEEVQKKCVDRLKHLYKQADIRKNFIFLHISKDKWRNANLK